MKRSIFLMGLVSLFCTSIGSLANDVMPVKQSRLPRNISNPSDRGIDWANLTGTPFALPEQITTGTTDYPVTGVRTQAILWAVSDSGQVIVGETAPGVAMSWHTGQTTILNADTSWAYAINAANEIVGTRTNAQGYYRGVVWRESGAVEIGTLGTGNQSWGEDINDNGVVAGTSHTTAGGAGLAIRWTEGGGLEGLQPLPNGGGVSFFGSLGYGLNSSNVVAGVSAGSDAMGQVNHATLWDAGGTPSRIGIIGSDRSSFAQQVNDSGQACGYSSAEYGSSPYRGFFWDGSSTTDIGNLGEVFTIPEDINNLGQVVGWSYINGTTRHAFIWEDGVMTDLNDLIDPSSGWLLEGAYGINDQSQIVGWGSRNAAQYGFFLCLPCCPDSGVVTIVALADSTDSDGDGLFDEWEKCGVDGDDDGSVDLHLLNADVRRKDIYVEVDAMSGMAPPSVVLDSVVLAFDNAPVTNAIGSPPGIALHFVGGRGDSLCDPCFDDTTIGVASWPDPDTGWVAPFHAIKSSMFGTQKEQSGSDFAAIQAAKLMTYRYCIIAKDFVTSTASGSAELLGNDFTVALDKWPKPLPNDAYMAVLMHELGHTLGLSHGGGQIGPPGDLYTYNYKPNYYSIMNYTWETRLEPQLSLAPKAIQTWRNGWRLDYSREAFLDLDEGSLDEAQGVGGGDTTVWVPVGGQLPGDLPELVQMGGPADFDRDGSTTNPSVAADMNHLDPSWPSTSEPLLEGFNDWASIDYLPNSVPAWADGPSLKPQSSQSSATIVSCLTYDEYVALSETRFDCNGNGIFDDVEIGSGELDDVNDNGIPDDCENLGVVGVGDISGDPKLLLSVVGAVASPRKIQFYNPKEGPVTLRVFDVSGRQVRELVDDTLPAGWYESSWPAQGVRGRVIREV